jgi:hypothetical protein
MVEAILDSEVFGSPHSRELLVWLTGEALGYPLDLAKQATAMLQCVELIRVCAHETGGLFTLSAMVSALAPDDPSTRRLAELVEERRAEAVEERDGTPLRRTGEQNRPPRPVPVPQDSDDRKDFFISYTAVDRRWAVWIAWELEEAGYSVLVQEWDFVPGINWQMGMERGVTECDRTIAVLSPAYLKTIYGRQEWQAAQGADPTGFARRLVPVRIAACTPGGLLASVVFIDLVGMTGEQAHVRLLAGINEACSGRAKPAAPPRFPG